MAEHGGVRSYQGEQQTQAFIQDSSAGQDYASLAQQGQGQEFEPHAAQYGCGQEAAEQQPGPQGQGTYADHEPGDIAAGAHQQVLLL